jgi:hypothetical protein
LRVGGVDHPANGIVYQVVVVLVLELDLEELFLFLVFECFVKEGNERSH